MDGCAWFRYIKQLGIRSFFSYCWFWFIWTRFFGVMCALFLPILRPKLRTMNSSSCSLFLTAFIGYARLGFLQRCSSTKNPSVTIPSSPRDATSFLTFSVIFRAGGLHKNLDLVGFFFSPSQDAVVCIGAWWVFVITKKGVRCYLSFCR